MDGRLTDLDALLVRVRERRSRSYIEEAVAAYRIGAYRAAVIGTWIAVVFDVLVKIREIAQAGDKAAEAFVADFDRAVEADNRERLLKLEGELLEKALEPFAFVGRQEYLQLKRLKDDRNLRAHPAFSTEAELFRPQPELVRLYIVVAIEGLLAVVPVQGKSMIDAFAADLASTAFPREREAAIRYVGERYLARLRPNAVDNLASVLLKGFLRATVPSWAGHEASILHSLAAVARFHPELWAGDVRVVASRTIDGLDGESLPRAFGMLKAFPELFDRLDGPTRSRLRAVIENCDSGLETDERVFAAAGLEPFQDVVEAAFDRLDADRQASVVQRFPDAHWVPRGIGLLRAAGSFRGAEQTFRRAVAPLASFYDGESMAALAQAVEDNSEAWDAARMPDLLAAFIADVPPHVQVASAPWTRLKAFLEGRTGADRYEKVWAVLRSRGVAT